MLLLHPLPPAKNSLRGMPNTLISAASQSPTTAVSESSKRRKTSTSTSTVSPKASQSTSPRNAHVPDASGGAPSAEIRILERAREAARVAVETSGSGKRPRVPSIKALRAAGKAGDEVVGAQLMTKELKEKALMRAKEMRAFRAAASAAGLASGQVGSLSTMEIRGYQKSRGIRLRCG